jgi:ABC-type phosphate/phosphonate transport system substrate-binding protein
VRQLLLASAIATIFVMPSVADDKKTLKIGTPRSAFHDVPDELLPFAGEPFQSLFKQQTGLDGELVQVKTAFDVAEAIDKGTFAFGVLQGHEYAWVKQKYPAMQALFCSCEKPKELRALLLVREDSKLNCGEFRQAKLALPSKLRDSARLFLNLQKGEGGFASTQQMPTIHDAIHAVLKGEADVTVADSASWNYFQELYPGPSKSLKVLKQSDPFPQSVLVYKAGSIGDDELKKVRDGFLSAHSNPKVKKLLTTIRIESFEAVPMDYDASIVACLKAYPKPLEGK